MAELLKIVVRGAQCEAEAEIDGFDQAVGRLVCNLAPDHPGPLHFDSIDRIWWSADA